MNRRRFLAAAAAMGSVSLSQSPVEAQNYSDYSKDPRPDVKEGTFTAGSDDGKIFEASPVVCGPGPDAITILQPLERHAIGYLEYAIEDGLFQRVDTEKAGMLPYSAHVLKFRLPPLPQGKRVRYRCVARTAGWVKVRQFYHGELKLGQWQTGPEFSLKSLDGAAPETKFAIWNDTHES